MSVATAAALGTASVSIQKSIFKKFSVAMRHNNSFAFPRQISWFWPHE